MVQKAYNPGGTTIRVDTASPDDFRAESLWDYEVFAQGEVRGRPRNGGGQCLLLRHARRAAFGRHHRSNAVRLASRLRQPLQRPQGAKLWRRRAAELEVQQILLGNGRNRPARDEIHSRRPGKRGLRGNEFDRSPHFTGSLAIDWKPTDRARLSAQVRHHSPYFTDPENSRSFALEAERMSMPAPNIKSAECRSSGRSGTSSTSSGCGICSLQRPAKLRTREPSRSGWRRASRRSASDNRA